MRGSPYQGNPYTGLASNANPYPMGDPPDVEDTGLRLGPFDPTEGSNSDWMEEHTAESCLSWTPIGMVLHLKLRRRDGRDGISWDILQQVKNDLAGEDAMAVEIYPPQCFLVNEANMRHLWVIPAEWLPIGLHRIGG
jgi:hypothetical protein